MFDDDFVLLPMLDDVYWHAQMFEKSPDQLASLKVQMMDKTAYCTQRHIILLDDTAKNLKEGMSIYDAHLTSKGWS